MMLRCYLTRKKLEASRAGELSRAEALRVQGHLDSCRFCERERLTLDRLMNKLDGLEGIKPSPGFASAFWRKVRDAGPGEAVGDVSPRRFPGMRPGWQWGMGLSSAAGLVILAMAYLLWGAVQFPRQNGGFTAPVEVSEIDENIDFYRDLEIIEEMGDFVGPELPGDVRREGTS